MIMMLTADVAAPIIHVSTLYMYAACKNEASAMVATAPITHVHYAACKNEASALVDITHVSTLYMYAACKNAW